MSTIYVMFRVRPGKREEFLQSTQSMQKSLKAEEGLSKFSLSEDMDDSTVFYLKQDWATQDSMERYLRSEQFSVFMGMLKVLCAESEIKYRISAGKPDASLVDI